MRHTFHGCKHIPKRCIFCIILFIYLLLDRKSSNTRSREPKFLCWIKLEKRWTMINIRYSFPKAKVVTSSRKLCTTPTCTKH